MSLICPDDIQGTEQLYCLESCSKVQNSLYVYVFIQVRAYKHVKEGLIKEQGKFYPLILSRALK